MCCVVISRNGDSRAVVFPLRGNPVALTSVGAKLLRRIARWPTVVEIRLVEEDAHASAATASPAASIDEIASLAVRCRQGCLPLLARVGPGSDSGAPATATRCLALIEQVGSGDPPTSAAMTGDPDCRRETPGSLVGDQGGPRPPGLLGPHRLVELEIPDLSAAHRVRGRQLSFPNRTGGAALVVGSRSLPLPLGMSFDQDGPWTGPWTLGDVRVGDLIWCEVGSGWTNPAGLLDVTGISSDRLSGRPVVIDPGLTCWRDPHVEVLKDRIEWLAVVVPSIHAQAVTSSAAG